LNEKRQSIIDIETRQQVTVLVVPNQHFMTPHYEVERIRTSDLSEKDEKLASYKLVVKPEVDLPQMSMTAQKDHQEPAIKGTLSEQPFASPPPPPSSSSRTKSSPSLLKRLVTAVFGKKEEEPAKRPTSGDKRRPGMHTSSRGGKNRPHNRDQRGRTGTGSGNRRPGGHNNRPHDPDSRPRNARSGERRPTHHPREGQAGHQPQGEKRHHEPVVHPTAHAIHETAPISHERHERTDRPVERAPDRNVERTERPERAERTERTERTEKLERPERTERQERTERTDRNVERNTERTTTERALVAVATHEVHVTPAPIVHTQHYNEPQHTQQPAVVPMHAPDTVTRDTTYHAPQSDASATFNPATQDPQAQPAATGEAQGPNAERKPRYPSNQRRRKRFSKHNRHRRQGTSENRQAQEGEDIYSAPKKSGTGEE
jgi:ribonuclease E